MAENMFPGPGPLEDIEKFLYGLQRWGDAEKIIRALAGSAAPLRISRDLRSEECLMCTAWSPAGGLLVPAGHTAPCPWRQAREWAESMDKAREAGA